MTFIVAFARPDVALLASDTRTTSRPGPDLPATGYDDARVKLYPWGEGWLASGPSVRWSDLLLAGVDHAAAMAALEAEDPAHARIVRERQATLTVEPGLRRMVDWQGRDRWPDAKPSDVFSLCPNGSDPAVLQRLLNAYQRTIRGASLRDVLDATVALYGRIFEHCGPAGTVSPFVSIGLVHADGRRELLGPMPPDAFLREAVLLNDGKYAFTSSAVDGLTADTNAKESAGKALNRLLAKPLAADPDTLDSTADGVTYKRITGVSSGLVQTASLAALAVTPPKAVGRSRCRVYDSASSQTITNNTDTIVTWPNESFDVDGLHSTASNTGRITIPSSGDIAGLWLIHAVIRWQQGATGFRWVKIKKNGATIVAEQIMPALGTNSEHTMMAALFVNDPTAGDYYEVEVKQTNGANLLISCSGDVQSYFEAIHLW